MATIAEIRKKYPQYDDMSDTQLADSFQAKYYSDLSKEEVYSKLGITAAKQEPVVPPKEEGFFDRITRTSMTPKNDGSFLSGYSKGMTDPFAGVAQLGLKGAAAVGVPGAQQQADNFTNQDKAYEASRTGQGFDVGRLMGGVTNPAYLAAPFTAGGAMRTGAIAGASQPVASDDFWTSKALQTGVGAVAAPLIQGSASLVGKLITSIKGMSPTGRQQAALDVLNKAAGPDRDKVINALRDAQELVTGSKPTVAEALANIPSAAELAGLQAQLSRQEGSVGSFAQRTADQQAARVRAIQGIAGTEAEMEAAKAARGAITGPMRETALNQSDMAAPIFTKLEKEIADGFNSLAAAEQTRGMTGLASKTQQTTAEAGKPGWLTAGNIASEASQTAAAYGQKAQTIRVNTQLKQYQLKSLEDNGFFPLKAEDITSRLDSAIKGTVSDTNKKVLQAVKDSISSRADENGIIGSRDLYENVRKMSNQDISKLLGLGEQYASGGIPQQAAKALEQSKKLVDAALDKSTDGLWSKYLTTYSEHSTKINRMEVGSFLADKLQTPLNKEAAGAFSTAVENAAGTIKKATGVPRFTDLKQILTADEVKTVNSVVADFSRASKAKELSKAVGALSNGSADAAGAIPSLFDAKLTLFKSALRYLQQGESKKFNVVMTELMLDPGSAAQLMSIGVPKGKMTKLMDTLYNNLDEPIKKSFVNNFTTIPLSQSAGQ
jgi:hypothetical protein